MARSKKSKSMAADRDPHGLGFLENQDLFGHEFSFNIN